jgi:glycosidase
MYYGTEVLMKHPGDHHGDIRAEFPGGWDDHNQNAFTGEGLTAEQKNMQQYIATIQNWRKNKEVIHTGKLMHFVPENGVYTYFRYNAKETVMIVLNKNKSETRLQTERFAERMKGFSCGTEIISSARINDLTEIKIPAKTAMIIELK